MRPVFTFVFFTFVLLLLEEIFYYILTSIVHRFKTKIFTSLHFTSLCPTTGTHKNSRGRRPGNTYFFIWAKKGHFESKFSKKMKNFQKNFFRFEWFWVEKKPKKRWKFFSLLNWSDNFEDFMVLMIICLSMYLFSSQVL